MSDVAKALVKILHTKEIKIFGSVTHLILGFAIQQNKLTHKLLLFHAIITHIYDNHIMFEVSLHFWWIWPTVRRRVMVVLPSLNFWAILGCATALKCILLF